MAEPILKTCGCGARYSVEEWKKLPFELIREDGAGGMVESRTCTCMSSIAVEVRVVCMYMEPE